MLKIKAAAGFIIFFIIAGAGLSPLYAAGRTDVLIGVTTAKRMIVNQNIQQAKQKAVSDALDIAVQNACAHLLSSQVFASNLDFFYDDILSHTEDYIITYRVLGGVESKGFYLVGVESKVDLGLLEKTMTGARIINADKDKPVLLFFIAEKMPVDLLPKYWWGKNPNPYESIAEDLIVTKLRQDRYVITGIGPQRPDPSFYDIKFGSIYDVSAAKELGSKLKADMIVFGRADSSEAINRIGEERTFHAQINLEAYNVETGEKALISQIQAVVKSDTDQEGNIQAMLKAAELSYTDLDAKIKTYWQQTLRKEQSFDVRLEGDQFLKRFIAMKKRFRQMPGIENMQPKEVGSNSAVMEVFYKGSPTKFANTVALKTFDSFGLEIMDVTDTLVTIRFIGKGQELPPEDTSGIQEETLE